MTEPVDIDFLVGRLSVQDFRPVRSDLYRALAELKAAREVIQAADALHRPETIGWGPDVLGCSTCDAILPETWSPGTGEQPWPCDTHRALADSR